MKSDNEFLLYYYDETAAKEAVVSLFTCKKTIILSSIYAITFKLQNASLKMRRFVYDFFILLQEFLQKKERTLSAEIVEEVRQLNCNFEVPF